MTSKNNLTNREYNMTHALCILDN